MTKPPRLNQTFDYYTITSSTQGDNTWTLAESNIIGRLAEGTLIVKDARGEDIQYDLTIHTTYDTPLKKGNGILYNGDYYLLDDVRVTPNLNGINFMQFCLAKRTFNVDIQTTDFVFLDADDFVFLDSTDFTFVT